MNVDSIRAYCLSFPAATEKLQWGDALCFKVGAKDGAKMFAVLGLDQVRLTFKCTPEMFAELIERPDIRPSPYLGRYHWVMLDRLDAAPNDELKDLIRQSYEMVAAKSPARKASSPGRKKKEKKKAKTVRPKAVPPKLVTPEPRARKLRRRAKD
jgi:predicted DNA-binding protein (MmcQ/YjbR family)